eukprot:scaffold14896_cov55-Phaeocystis_antarctica.AAC.3
MRSTAPIPPRASLRVASATCSWKRRLIRYELRRSSYASPPPPARGRGGSSVISWYVSKSRPRRTASTTSPLPPARGKGVAEAVVEAVVEA